MADPPVTATQRAYLAAFTASIRGRPGPGAELREELLGLMRDEAPGIPTRGGGRRFGPLQRRAGRLPLADARDEDRLDLNLDGLRRRTRQLGRTASVRLAA